MSRELSKDTKFAISIEALCALAVAIATLVGMYEEELQAYINQLNND
jgi:hypothetical protein